MHGIMSPGATITVKEFQSRVIASQLMTAGELRAVVDGLPERARSSVDSIAGALLRAGHLTQFQLDEILEGRERSLVLGNYILLEQLGKGGMGTVYKASHRRMKRVAALKIVSPHLLQSEETLKRFEREVEAAARLEHQNIVTAYDADLSGDTNFLVMQYVDGENLSQIVRTQGVLPWDAAVDVVRQVARGLEYAHSQGIIHRDIKPGNLLLDSRGTVKILDLGLARFRDAGQSGADDSNSGELTGTGAAIGTVDYMSPEQALDSKSVDARSDLYSLGATLYFLVSGRVMFPGDSAMKKLLAHRDQPAPSLAEACPDAPPELEAVYRKLVAKNPRERMSSAAELVEVLSTLIDPDTWVPRTPAKVARDSGRVKDSSEAETVIGSATSVSRSTHTAAAEHAAKNPRPRFRYSLATAAAILIVGALVWWGISISRAARILPKPPSLKTPGAESPDEVLFNGGRQDKTSLIPKTFALASTIQSTSVDEGDIADIKIDGEAFTIDATTKSKRVWLNFREAAGENLQLMTDLRIHPTAENGYVKLVFMGKPEYYVMIAGEQGKRWIEIATSKSGKQVTLQEVVAPERLADAFTPLVMNVSGESIQFEAGGQKLLQATRPVRSHGQAAVTVHNWKCDFRNAQAVVDAKTE
ncbi:MAG: serine/threonine protein kinase [Planctomycetaceae bacterium]